MNQKTPFENAEAVAMWRQIESLAREINFPDRETKEFVGVSSSCGRIKYEIVQQAWTVLLYAQQGESVLKKHQKEVAAAIARYHALWTEWWQLEQAHPSCASIYKDFRFDHHPGLVRRSTGFGLGSPPVGRVPAVPKTGASNLCCPNH